MARVIDMHMHSTCSDGSDTLEELFANVVKGGINFFALTDHDTFEGCQSMRTMAKEKGITFINGVEFSCLIDGTDTDSDCHILGYNYDPDAPSIKRIMEKNQDYRKRKLFEILDFLKDTFGIVFSEEAVNRLKSYKIVGKPKVAEELLKITDCRTNDEVFEKYLDPFRSFLYIEAREAIEAIIAAGGVAVWAHPIGDDKEISEHDMGEKFINQLSILKEMGIKGLECCYSRYNEEEIDFLVKTARENDLYISGGSDYHGNKKPEIVLGQTGLTSRQQDYINIDELIGRK